MSRRRSPRIALSPAEPPREAEGNFSAKQQQVEREQVGQSVFRWAMLLWGFPLVFVISVGVLKSTCGA